MLMQREAPEGWPACRVCGCSEFEACWDDEDGACWWVEEDLCSHCAMDGFNPVGCGPEEIRPRES